MNRTLGLGLVLMGCVAVASGEETGRTPGRQTLRDVRQLGTALLLWQTARMEAWSLEERAAMAEKEEVRELAAKKAAIARGDYVDPDTLTPSQLLEHLRPLPGDLGETQRLEPAQVRALLQPPGAKPFLGSIPEMDGWGRPLEVRIDMDNLLNRTVIVVRSAGANGQFHEPPYAPGAFDSGAKLDDIVWIDGWFYRWPLGEAGPLTVNRMGTLNGFLEDDGL